MGTDKAGIAYHGTPQWRAVSDALRPLCRDVYWSCSAEQKSAWQIDDHAILDIVPGHGPASGLHAAFTKFQETTHDVTWLVVGCDYPNITTGDLSMLIAARGRDFDVITFSGDGGRNIEPMISVWESAAQRRFLASFSAGKDSPRLAITESRWRWIAPRDSSILANKNEP
jgi:molybdopterin-guanine dinucleotide biosynthesis protein A